MITDICTVFGCGVRLTNLEKLCGNVCTMHSGEVVETCKPKNNDLNTVVYTWYIRRWNWRPTVVKKSFK